MGHSIRDKSFPLRAYTVLASVSRSYSVQIGMFPCLTHPCATFISNSKLSNTLVQLACVKPAASVRSEPGSNSHIKMVSNPSLITHKESLWFLYYTQTCIYYHIYRLRILFLLVYIITYTACVSSSLFTLLYNHLGSNIHHRVGDWGYMTLVC